MTSSLPSGLRSHPIPCSMWISIDINGPVMDGKLIINKESSAVIRSLGAKLVFEERYHRTFLTGS